ncbi:MAG: hypothetical protein R3B07_34370 [Polyangiaceae bacterium]
MTADEYAEPENWHGSYYELSLEFSPRTSEAELLKALSLVWEQPEFVGPWVERSGFGGSPDAIVLREHQNPYHGVLRAADGSELGCLTFLIREDGGRSWLDISIPTGMIWLRYPAQYPIDLANDPAVAMLDQQLALIAARIYDEVPFVLGLLGEEASGADSAETLTKQRCEWGGYVVPAELWAKLAPERAPNRLGEKLVYAPLLGPHIAFGPVE